MHHNSFIPVQIWLRMYSPDCLMSICSVANIVGVSHTSKKIGWTFYFVKTLKMRNDVIKMMDNFMTRI